MSDSWYSVSPKLGYGNGKLTISAEPNTGPDRSATVAVSLANGSRRTVRISQEGLLTVSVEMYHPATRMYATVESDELYDYFSQIKRFEVTFTNYPSIKEPVIVKTSHFSEDGTNCFSEYVDSEKYNLGSLGFKLYFIAVQLLFEGKKYIQVSPVMEKL